MSDTAMVLEHATSLERSRAAAEVVLFASTVPSLAPLAGSGVKALRVLASSVTDWDSLAALDGLEELEVNFCLLPDTRTLAKLPSLRRVKMFGVPLDAASYEALMQRPRADCDVREDWEINRALADRGLGMCYSELSIGPLIVRPGLPTRGGRVDALNSYSVRLQKALDSGATGDAFLVAAGYADEPLREDGPSMFMAHWERGDAADARAWISAAQLDDANRRDLERFVERFGASHTFIRERPHAHTREEKLRTSTFPAALKRFRSEVIATVNRPNRRMTVQFDGYDFPLSDRTRDRWYEIGLLGYYNNSIRAVMDDWAHLYPIGYADGAAQTSGFGMPVAGDDGRVFEYSERDLYTEHKANSRYIPIYPAFRSWASLLGHVSAIR